MVKDLKKNKKPNIKEKRLNEAAEYLKKVELAEKQIEKKAKEVVRIWEKDNGHILRFAKENEQSKSGHLIESNNVREKLHDVQVQIKNKENELVKKEQALFGFGKYD